MWIKATTQLSDHVFQVATPVTTHLVAVSDAVVIIDSGITALAHHLVEQLTPFINDDRKFKCILLTHSGFDHVGGIPVLREFAPGVVVVASPQCAEKLLDQTVLRDRYDRNKECAEALGVEFPYSFEKWSEAVRVDHIIGEGDSVSLGEGVDVNVIACPGHTVEGVGYFVRPDEALGAGEAVGSYHGREKVAPNFQLSLTQYLATLDKLSKLNIRVLGLPHGGALTGELVNKFLMSVRLAAEKFPANMKERLEAGAIREEIAMDLLNEWTVDSISPEGPFARSQRDALERMIELALTEEVDTLEIE